MSPDSYDHLGRTLIAALSRFLDPAEARAEGRRWLEEGLGRSRSWLAAHGDDPVPGDEAERVEAWLERRRQGEPWAYILGWSAFRGRRYRVTPATLIPRPETELVLEAALEVGRRLNVLHACDVGTGSGILAISLALETDWAVAATDISAGALAVARENAAELQARVRFHQGDLLGAVPDPVGLVVSNPPYVDPRCSGNSPLSPGPPCSPRTGAWPWPPSCCGRPGTGRRPPACWRSGRGRARSWRPGPGRPAGVPPRSTGTCKAMTGS